MTLNLLNLPNLQADVFDALRQGDKAVSTTTGEELLVTELFSVNGVQMAKIKYLRDGAEGTSRIDFLSPAPSN